MADQVVTELVIDADTSGADRYSQAMDRAANSSQSGMSSVQGVSLAIAGVGAATVGALAGLRAFVDYVGSQTQALVDMQSRADLAGISVREFQETLYAAKAAGLKETDFVAGLDRITQDLTDAGRGVTQFSKLFEANGISIRNANGELKSTKQALADIANLMAQATPQQQQAMARIVGLSQSWIPFLRQGADAIELQKQKAADLGIIIDDATIAKARQFNDEWKAATAAWDLQFKRSLSEVLPLLIQLANIAAGLLEKIGSVSNTILRLTTPDDQKNQQQLGETINEVERLAEVMQKFGEQSFRATNLKGALGLPEDADLKQVYDYMTKISEQYDKMTSRLRVTPANQGGGINLPGLSDQKDALEKEIEAIDKHIAKLQADKEAIGENVGVQEELRVEAALYQAAIRAGFTDLEQYADRFKDIAERAGGARLELEKARVNAQIKFDWQSGPFSQEDVQIAQQLRGLYPDVATALGSVEAQAMRVNNAQKLISDGFRDVGQSIFTAFVTGKNVMDAMIQSLDNLSKKLADAAFNNIIDGLINGNPLQAGIGVVQAGASALISAFTGNQKKKEEEAKALKEAQDAWKKMSDQLIAFNHAAAGFDLGPLTQNIQSLVNSYTQLAEAANKAKEYGAVAQLQATFNLGLNRLVNSFISGSPVLTDLQQKMKAVMDEGQGMIETLISLGAATDATVRAIQDSINRQQSDLQRAFIADTEASLLADVRNNAGLGYLNTIGDAIKKFNSDISQGVSGGVATAWLSSVAQAAVDSSQLAGPAFQDMLAIFPELTGKIHEFVDTTALAAKAAADATEKLALQLRLLSATTDSSTLSGALALFDAKAKQEYDAAVASGSGNLTLLLQVQAAERQNIITNFAKQAADAEKQLADQRLAQIQRIQQYLDNLTAGSQSTLSPGDRLAAAQSQFTSQLAAAKGGDQNAISNITSYSDNLLQSARDFFGSTTGYQQIFQQVQSSLAGLIATGLISGVSSGLPGTTGSTPVGSVSGSTGAPAAANSNSLSAVVAAINDLAGKVVVVQAKLDNIKSSVDGNTEVVGAVHDEEQATLQSMDGSLKFLKNAAEIAAA